LNAQIRRVIEAEPIDRSKLESLLHDAEAMHLPLDRETLEFAARRKVETAAEVLYKGPSDSNALRHLREVIAATRLLPFPVSLWQVENAVAANADGNLSTHRSSCEQGDQDACEWVTEFTSLADQLRLKVS
jgi:hypothetical protein